MNENVKKTLSGLKTVWQGTTGVAHDIVDAGKNKVNEIKTNLKKKQAKAHRKSKKHEARKALEHALVEAVRSGSSKREISRLMNQLGR